MCELLGMSANVPTDIVFSFTGLMQRGGGTGPHRDGWGIAFYEGRGVRLFQDPLASVDSEVARLVQRFPIKSETVIGHIRQANVGKVGLSNTHPFIRELGGRYWTFAHNGQLADFQPKPGFYRPVGETDSEAAFCDLLNRVRRAFPEPVPVEVLLPVLISACDEYRKKGVFNALISDGDWLFTFCSSKLAYITRRAPFGPARLKDADLTVDFHAETTPDDVVTVIATEPLTDNENWTLQQSGEWVLWWGGGRPSPGGGAEHPGLPADRRAVLQRQPGGTGQALPQQQRSGVPARRREPRPPDAPRAHARRRVAGHAGALVRPRLAHAARTEP